MFLEKTVSVLYLIRFFRTFCCISNRFFWRFSFIVINSSILL